MRSVGVTSQRDFICVGVEEGVFVAAVWWDRVSRAGC